MPVSNIGEHFTDNTRLSRVKTDGYAIIPGVFSSEKMTELDQDIKKTPLLNPGGHHGWKKGTTFNTTAIAYFSEIVAQLNTLLAKKAAAPKTIRVVTATKKFSGENKYILDPHVDGKGCEEQCFEIYDAIVGICLTDVQKSDCGNLVVWPGSHKRIQEKLRQTPSSEIANRVLKKKFSEQGDGETLYWNAGDIVICHTYMWHAVQPNRCDIDRIMLYGRLNPDPLEEDGEVDPTRIVDPWQ